MFGPFASSAGGRIVGGLGDGEAGRQDLVVIGWLDRGEGEGERAGQVTVASTPLA
jgi:hypothetical protein